MSDERKIVVTGAGCVTAVGYLVTALLVVFVWSACFGLSVKVERSPTSTTYRVGPS